MAVQVGALELAIGVPGGNAAIALVERLDAVAAKLGARPTTFPIDPGAQRGLANIATEAQRALAGVEKLAGGNLAAITQRVQLLGEGMRTAGLRIASLGELQRVEDGLTARLRAGNLSLEQRIVLERQLRATQGAIKGGSVVGRVGTFLSENPIAAGVAGALGGLGIASAVQGTIGMIGSAIEASNKYAASLRILDSTAKLTGVPLAFLRTTSDALSKSFGTTATQTNTMVATAVRFTAAAGKVNETGAFLTNWLNLAAARGLTANEAMSKLQTTLEGQDEGLNALGLANPSDIYKRWATEVGGLAGKLTDAQQKHTIFNEVMQKGGLIGNAFAAQMDTAQGAVIRLDNAKQDFLVTLGNAITGTTEYNSTVGTFTGLIQDATRYVTEHRSEVHGLVGVFGDLAGILSSVAGMLGGLGRVLDVVNGFAQKLSGTLNAAFRVGAGLPAAASAGVGGGAPFVGGMGNPLASPDGVGALGLLDAVNVTARRSPTRRARAGRGTSGAAAARNASILAGDRDRTSSEGAFDPLDTLRAPGDGGFGVIDAIRRGLPTADSLSATITPALAGVAAAVRKASGWASIRASFAERTQNLFTALPGQIGDSLGNALGAGITAAVKGKNFFAAFGSTLLSSFGSIMTQLGGAMLTQGAVMVGLLPAITDPFTSGPALLAAGAVLVALGATLGAISGGKGGGGGGRGGSSSYSGPGASLDSSFTLAPRAAPVGGQQAPTGRSGDLATQRPFIFAPTIIGQNDPVAQRQLANMVAKAANRGIGP